jgi:hypothetical protein
MQHLTVSTQPAPVTSPKAAGHWLRQLIALFPTTSNEVTEEATAAMVLVFTQYPESLLREICSPLTGMAANFEFLPGLFKFRQFCEAKAAEISERERWVREASKPRTPVPPPDPFAGCYTGPIEQIKPGDILHCTRFEEYREFMRKNKNMPNAKLWGLNDKWVDSGQRPFNQINSKPQANIEDASNPFDP